MRKAGRGRRGATPARINRRARLRLRGRADARGIPAGGQVDIMGSSPLSLTLSAHLPDKVQCSRCWRPPIRGRGGNWSKAARRELPPELASKTTGVAYRVAYRVAPDLWSLTPRNAES